MIDELERRVRTLEQEFEGEKAVTRHILQETRQNSGDLAAIKAQLMHLAGDMTLANAALIAHGTRLNTLTQDVALIRQDTIELRRTLEEVSAKFDVLQQDVGQLRQEVTLLRRDVEALRTHMDERFDAVLEAIRALGPRRGIEGGEYP